jgi:hypothetical protein
MQLPDKTSLAKTVNAVNDAVFFNKPLSKTARERTARWIASRAGERGSYNGMPAPLPADFAHGVRVFTGEKRSSGAGTSHILGEEACRALILLDVDTAAMRKAHALATERMAAHLRALPDSIYWQRAPGMFCCGICSVALWRHMAVGGFACLDSEEWLATGLKTLKTRRTNDGKWKPFPFHYTLACLCELDVPGVVAELRYAGASCERIIKRTPRDDVYDTRRQAVAERVLARI